jgi:uncharacterized membrane protein
VSPEASATTPWHFRARGRTVLGIFAAIAAFSAVPGSLALRVFAAWDAYAWAQVALIVALASRGSSRLTKARCVAEDPGRRGVFALMVVASLASLFAAIGALRHVKDWSPQAPIALEIAAILAVVAGWALVHATYGLRYARLYYTHAPPGGLDFPRDETATGREASGPDDLDFLYFAVTIGMTFQTADVAITHKRIRRTVLAHALHAFLYNTVIVALALNFVLGLSQ